MKLKFDARKINKLSEQYEANLSNRDRKLTDAIIQHVFPSYRTKGFLTKNEFLTVCNWKTPRARSHCEKNDDKIIREISELVKATDSELLRIQVWTLLSGVGWPTASVFLHFGFPNQYPILDYRALFSIGVDKPPNYNFEFWWEYVTFCRSLAAKANVTMRTLDQTLWQYSKNYQIS